MRSMSMVHVIAVITAKPGMRGQILEAFQANVPAVHAEDGCIEYGATVDADGVGPFQTRFGDDTFVVVEKWESLDHLLAHAASDHMKAYGAKTKDFIAERKVHVMSSV
jgi:quinol monooxygenase YgiN